MSRPRGPLRERVGSHAQQLGVPLRLSGALAPEQQSRAAGRGAQLSAPAQPSLERGIGRRAVRDDALLVALAGDREHVRAGGHVVNN